MLRSQASEPLVTYVSKSGVGPSTKSWHNKEFIVLVQTQIFVRLQIDLVCLLIDLVCLLIDWSISRSSLYQYIIHLLILTHGLSPRALHSPTIIEQKSTLVTGLHNQDLL